MKKNNSIPGNQHDERAHIEPLQQQYMELTEEMVYVVGEGLIDKRRIENLKQTIENLKQANSLLEEENKLHKERVSRLQQQVIELQQQVVGLKIEAECPSFKPASNPNRPASDMIDQLI